MPPFTTDVEDDGSDQVVASDGRLVVLNDQQPAQQVERQLAHTGPRLQRLAKRDRLVSAFEAVNAKRVRHGARLPHGRY